MKRLKKRLAELKQKLRFAWLAFKHFDQVQYGLTLATELNTENVNAMPSQIADLLASCLRVRRLSKLTGAVTTQQFRLFE